jgi:small subunit ribosomal protein S3
LENENNGPENTSLRLSAANETVAFALVCQETTAGFFRRPQVGALKKQLQHAGVANIEVERMANKLRITIYTSRPGIIIGRKGAEIDKLKVDIQKRTNREVYINIQEIHRPELDAQLVAESIAMQLEKRIAFRRAMRKSVDSALRFGAKGIKVRVSGRLNGAEIARSEWYLQGRAATLRADIDYGFAQSHDLWSHQVKCWIYKGEICRTARLRGRRLREFKLDGY